MRFKDVRNSKYSPSYYICQVLSERTSLSASPKGSITVEAALAVPIFFLAVVSLLYLFEIIAVQTSVRAGLQYAGKNIAKEAYVDKILMPAEIERDVIEAIGEERLDRSIVLDGCGGIHCNDSRLSARTGIGILKASYDVRLPIPVFRGAPIKYQVTRKIKAWTGYEKEFFGAVDDKTVYVTETGLVYHTDYHCTHLDLSIHMISKENVSSERNESGGKYYPCEQCCSEEGGLVYITDTGDRYHSALSCSGLKRTVYAVPLSEVIGKGACSRCGH